MSISEQVKELRYKADTYNTVGSAWELNRAEAKILQGLLREAADTIESLSKKLQAANMEQSAEDCDGWIPCKERLPETRNNILICQGNGYVSVGYYAPDRVFLDLNSVPFDSVVAWRELPEPYPEP